MIFQKIQRQPMTDRRHSYSASNEGGIYLLLFALFLAVLAIFAASMIGLGFLTNAKIGAQNTTNLAGLACLNAFTHASADDPSNRYLTQAEACRDAALDVLKKSKISGLEDFSNLTTQDTCFASNESSCADTVPLRITLGRYYLQQPVTESNTLCSDYPCFVSNDQAPASGLPSTISADAVRLQIAGEERKPQAWVRLLSSGQKFQTVATAAIVPRCVSFLLDLSASTAFQTHLPWTWANAGAKDNSTPCNYVSASTDVNGNPPFDYFDTALPGPSCPPQDDPRYDGNIHGDTRPALYVSQPAAYTVGLPSFTFNTASPSSSAPTDCSSVNLNPEQIYWCNMPDTRPDPNDVSQTYPAWHLHHGEPGYRSIQDPDFPLYHYKSDFLNLPDLPNGYIDMPGWIGWTYIDLLYIKRGDTVFYEGPQPFSAFFMAMNASIRAMQSISSNADSAVVMPFAVDLRNPEPSSGMTQSYEQMGYLAQLTNLDNGGRYDYVNTSGAPTYQLVPNMDPHEPNYLTKGWIVMQRPGMEAVDGQTNLVGGIEEAIDRMKSCPANSKKIIILATDGVSTCNRTSADGVVPRTYDCGLDYDNHYSVAQSQLLGGLLNNLKASGISLSVLYAGASVNPNIINRPFPNNSGGYLDSSDARAYGYCGGLNPAACTCSQPPCTFLDSASTDGQGHTDFKSAFDAIPNPGAYFGEASAAMVDLAFGSGGDFCALMPKCNKNALPGDPAAPNNPNACDQPNDSCYKDDDGDPSTPAKLIDAARNSGARQTCSVYDLNPAEQGARCTINAVSSNSLVLVGDN